MGTKFSISERKNTDELIKYELYNWKFSGNRTIHTFNFYDEAKKLKQQQIDIYDNGMYKYYVYIFEQNEKKDKNNKDLLLIYCTISHWTKCKDHNSGDIKQKTVIFYDEEIDKYIKMEYDIDYGVLVNSTEIKPIYFCFDGYYKQFPLYKKK